MSRFVTPPERVAPALCAALGVAGAVAQGITRDPLASSTTLGILKVPDETWMSGIGVQAAEEMLTDLAKATGVEPPKR
ncbi:iron chelate uptake ABC transporter family permease subunit [Streptomyces phaeolivaceus]|uniref:Iron chelate uptake ABC transporter family permease subunit n=1 Tax=Streptomyces phaeolivaceus TaxID=2653200 RepID=A0A5P8JWS8_9ACTN|nr:iron chelate uptake ABC transporter family permease subunit [Streptomyces phaeolivaceus]